MVIYSEVIEYGERNQKRFNFMLENFGFYFIEKRVEHNTIFILNRSAKIIPNTNLILLLR